MYKTFEVHSKWHLSVFYLHSYCILNSLTALQQHSKHSGVIRGRIDMASHFKSWQNVRSALHQLIKHGRLRVEVVEEGLWSSTLSSFITHQPSPFLCMQPWTGLISSHPLSFPSLLQISFKQVLLEDSYLEQSNIVQGPYMVRLLLRLMKKLDLPAFYTLSGNSPQIFMIHFDICVHNKYIQSTLEVHSRYSSCIFFNSWMLKLYSAAILQAL